MLLITSLNLFNISNNFWKDSLGSSIHRSMLSENPNSFTFSFSSLIALASIYSIVLNICGRTNILVLFLTLRGKPLNPSPLSVMLTVGFSQISFMGLRKLPLTQRLLSVFIKKMCQILSNVFLHLSTAFYPTDEVLRWLILINHWWINDWGWFDLLFLEYTHLAMVCNSFCTLLDLVC